MAANFIQLPTPKPGFLEQWFNAVYKRLGGDRSNILYVPSFAKANLPSAAEAAGIIYVTDEVGGAVLAFSDGTNWRRVTDRAIVA